MANRFWVLGTGNSNDTAHWSTSSGGAGGASAPTSADNVIFDSLSNATSYTFTVNATFTCLDLNTSPPLSGTMTFTHSNPINIHGSLTFDSALVYSTAGWYWTFKSTSTGKTITTAGKQLDLVQFNGLGGGWTLQDTYTAKSTGGVNWQILNGTINTGNQSVTLDAMTIEAGTTRAWTIGSSIVTFRIAGTVFDYASLTGFTLNANTSTIKLTNSSTSSKTFQGGGLTWYNFEVATGNTGATIITGSNTFNNIYINGSTRKLHFTAGTTTTFTAGGTNGITTSGTGIEIKSATAANHTLTKTSGTVTVQNCTITNSQAGGGATWVASISAGNVNGGSNSGWNFAALPPIGMLFGTLRQAIKRASSW